MQATHTVKLIKILKKSTGVGTLATVETQVETETVTKTVSMPSAGIAGGWVLSDYFVDPVQNEAQVCAISFTVNAGAITTYPVPEAEREGDEDERFWEQIQCTKYPEGADTNTPVR